MHRFTFLLLLVTASGSLLSTGCDQIDNIKNKVTGEEDSADVTTTDEAIANTPAPTPIPEPEPKTAAEIMSILETTPKRDINDSVIANVVSGLEEIDGLSEVKSLDLGGTSVGQASIDLLPKFEELASLRLSRMRLSQANLAPLSQLKMLEELDVSFGGLSDSHAAAISNISSLKHLDVNDNAITDEGLAALGKLSALEHLAVSRNSSITGRGFDSWTGGANLKHLYMASTQAAAWPQGLLRFKGSLETLILFKTGWSDNQMKGVKTFSKLKTLNLGANSISDLGAQQLKNWKTIEFLSLSHSKGISNATLGLLVGCTNLTELHVEGTSINEQGARLFMEKKNGPIKILIENDTLEKFE